MLKVMNFYDTKESHLSLEICGSLTVVLKMCNLNEITVYYRRYRHH